MVTVLSELFDVVKGGLAAVGASISFAGVEAFADEEARTAVLCFATTSAIGERTVRPRFLLAS